MLPARPPNPHRCIVVKLSIVNWAMACGHSSGLPPQGASICNMIAEKLKLSLFLFFSHFPLPPCMQDNSNAAHHNLYAYLRSQADMCHLQTLKSRAQTLLPCLVWYLLRPLPLYNQLQAL